MEAFVQTKQWKYAKEQLEVCERRMNTAAEELYEVCRGLCKTENDSLQIVRRKLEEYQNALYEQAGVLADMGTVLEKARYRYATCEDRIIQSAETDSRLFEETLASIKLSEFAQIKVFLE